MPDASGKFRRGRSRVKRSQPPARDRLKGRQGSHLVLVNHRTAETFDACFRGCVSVASSACFEILAFASPSARHSALERYTSFQSQREEGTLIALTHNQARRAVRAALQQAHDPRIHGVKIARRRRRGTLRDELVVTFKVSRKVRPEGKIPPGYVIPAEIIVPKEGPEDPFTIGTDVVSGKRMRFRAGIGSTGDQISVRNAYAGPGALGAVLRDEHANRYILSCSHVLTDYGRHRDVNTEIVHTSTGSLLGHLTCYTPVLPNTSIDCDAALAQVAPQFSGNNHAALRSLATDALRESDPVKLLLTGTDYRSGIVSSPVVSEKVYWPTGTSYAFCILHDQVEVTNLGAPGDSGSAVVDDQGGLVGLFVADDGKYDLVTPIVSVMSGLCGDARVFCSPEAFPFNRLELA